MESTEEEAEEATMDAASNHDRLRKIARALELNEQLVQRLESRRARLLEELDELDADLDAVDGDGDGDQEIEEEEEEVKPPPPMITSNAQKKKAVSLIPFTRPYFRDSLGMSAPPCKTELYSPSPAFVDLLSMRSRGGGGGGGGHHNQWTEAERETIVKEVRSQYRMVHNRELVEQMTRLLEESSGQGQGQGPTAEVTKRIEQLNDQLALARSGGDPEPERGEEAMRAIDWMVVAKQVSGGHTVSIQ